MKNREYEELINLIEQWYMYLKGGYTLSQALDFSLQDKFDKNLKTSLEFMTDDLNKGISPEKAVTRCSGDLPEFFIKMFQMASRRGRLTQTLKNLKNYYKKRADYRRELIKKIYYPMFTMMFFMLMIFISLNFFLPALIGVYQDMSLEMPYLTKLFLSLNDFLTLPVIILLIFLIWAAGILLKRKFLGTKTSYILFDKMPVLSSFIRFRLLGAFFDSLLLSLESGTEITESIRQSAEVTENDFYIKKGEEIIADLNSGRSLAESLNRWLPIPENLQEILLGGERTGSFLKAVSFCAQYCRRKEKGYMDRFSVSLEPALILILAVMVGLLAVVLLAPLWELYGSFAGI
ncbi:type II secretion system F family protein [Halarsenatibacter silvermanii]|uniref:Type II secretory pathway, component PulF n=1 Tax=Halarsenatibacter silvermanii TaxID=321763 RepID=A0A1G9JZZ2_9FIRM|nr:type II secretion system F family protein [Halarsenatibacter silvermanii]SDL43002.1 Type II secretory pathway, component PulF [Halarsenatibacter silvermanii]